MSAAMKTLTARTKRAKLIAAMGLVNRDDQGFNVKSPTRNKDNYRVWRDEKGRVRCSCAEFESGWKEDPRFRCEHILAVKYHLEPPTETGGSQQATTSENEERAGAESVEVLGAATNGHQEKNGPEGKNGYEVKEEKREKRDIGGVEMVDNNIAGKNEVKSSENVVSFSHLLKELSSPIPRELVRQRVGWTDNSGMEHEIDYIEWHTVADVLDRVCPEWSHSVKDIRQIGDLLAVTASITILGVTREGVGTGAAYDEKGIKKAEHDALKRAAVKFGIAREIYKKDEDDTAVAATGSQPVVRFPRDPIAKNISEIATSKQLAAIRAIGKAQGVDADAECSEMLNCKLESLSRRAASVFIDYLKNKQLSADEVRQVS